MEKDEIINKMKDVMPFDLPDKTIPYIKEAMKIFTELKVDQKTSELKSELAEKDKEINKLQYLLNTEQSAKWRYIADYKKQVELLKNELSEEKSKYDTLVKSHNLLGESVIRINKELNELKEKHKNIFDKMITWVDDDFTRGLFIELFNEGYKQKFESNDNTTA